MASLRRQNPAKLSFQVAKEILSLYASKLWVSHAGYEFSNCCGTVWTNSDLKSLPFEDPKTHQKTYSNESAYEDPGPLLEAFISILTRDDRFVCDLRDNINVFKQCLQTV